MAETIRRPSRRELERAGLEIGETPEFQAGRDLRTSVNWLGRQAGRAGSALAGAARQVGGVYGSALSLTPEERAAAGYAPIPEIGEEPIGDYARGLGMIERAPLPPQPDALAGRTVGQASGRYARRTAIPEIGQPIDDEAARAGVRARAMVPREVGPIDPLSLSASDIESDMGSRALLDDRYRQRLESLDIGDPYLRARQAEGEAYAHTAGLENLALVPEDEAPDTLIYQEGGVFKNRRAPRMTGKEYKAALLQQQRGELEIGARGIQEQMRAQTEINRRQELKKELDKIDADHRQREDQLRQTHTGDQLTQALEQLREAREQALERVLSSFQAGARFNIKGSDAP